MRVNKRLTVKDMNQLIKPAKKALSERYDYKNVSVKNGTGTAWGWVEISVSISKSEDCTCEDGGLWCSTCRNLRNETSSEVRNIISKAWTDAGLKPYTYLSDMGDDHDEILIDVTFIKVTMKPTKVQIIEFLIDCCGYSKEDMDGASVSELREWVIGKEDFVIKYTSK